MLFNIRFNYLTSIIKGSDRNSRMKEIFFWDIDKTDFGYFGVIAGEEGIICSMLPDKDKKSLIYRIENIVNKKQINVENNKEKCEFYINQLKRYYLKQIREIKVPLNFSGYSDFDVAVWKCAMRIPYGQVRSYGWIAEEIGRKGAARAVGNALGRNPFAPIVPCHRVVAGDMRIGGFSGGVELKKSLLELEGIEL